MSGRPQIHIFFGAPIIQTPLGMLKAQSFPGATAETWKELHLSSDKHAFHLFAGKCKSTDRVEHQAPDHRDPTVHTRDHFSVNSEQGRFGMAEDYLASCVPVIGGMETHVSTLKRTSDVTCYGYQISGDRDTCKNMNQVVSQQLPHIFTKTDGQHRKPSNDCFSNLTEKGVRHLEDKSCDISDLVSSTKQISIQLKSTGRDVPSDHLSVHHEHLSQYLEMFFPKIGKESKTKRTLSACSDFAISADTEFLSIMTSSQVAVLAQKHFKEQNQIQKEAIKPKEIEVVKKGGESEVVLDEPFQATFVVGACINVAGPGHQESASSLEFFSSESGRKTSYLESTGGKIISQENAEDSQELVSVVDEQLLNEICIEPLSTGILCSQVDNYKASSKRTRTSEDTLSISYSALKTQQKSKRAKLICSKTSPETKVDQKMSKLWKLQKNPLLLKNCCCKRQKYSVLVTVVHPCHIKEIQIKSRPKSSSKVPIATIVVIDQSEIERKVVLWEAAAFWSLTVFPGDIILLTDVTVYENHWYGERMLQSTFTSQLFNLGSSSAIDPKEFSHVVDVDVLQDLLAYVSSKFAYFRDLPHRKPQKLDSIQHVQLDQLQPDTLVHSILKLVSITVQTESVYSYKGEKQRKIILTVEQIRDQHYVMVLWGASAAWCPQLQRKKDHIWEFKYLLAQCSSVSGDLELHTTPWSSCECLFDDDKRTVEFKEKFKKSEKSFMTVTNLSSYLEGKYSGVIQLKAHVLELKFTIAAAQYRQLIFDADTSLECILASLPMIIYSGCAKCGLELQTDENKIYKQCLSCLPFNKVRKFYRPALMTAKDTGCEICIQVVSELMEKIFLNIPADWLNRFIVPPSDTTYGMIVADLCHSLLADTEASYLLDIRSHFVLDENSYPLQQDFFLMDFHPDL